MTGVGGIAAYPQSAPRVAISMFQRPKGCCKLPAAMETSRCSLMGWKEDWGSELCVSVTHRCLCLEKLSVIFWNEPVFRMHWTNRMGFK